MTTDLVVIGAGMIGAAVSHFAAAAGLSVLVLERGAIASGTSSHGEGNVLVSDKELGPELDLALYSNTVWRDDLGAYGDRWEFRPKGGLVVSRTAASLESLSGLVATQQAHGIRAEMVDATGVRELEPNINPALTGGAWYPEDAQVQPILATAHLLRLAREHGATVRQHAEVTGLLRERERVVGVRVGAEEIPAGAVVNATGPWAPTIGALAGLDVPVQPRRGFVLVSEPLPPTVLHKVYAAEYVGDVGSGDAALQASPVVEATDSGTLLIGATRERVGFAPGPSVAAVQLLAARALELFPALAGVSIMRTYWGYRPYCEDHLPIIGPDPRAPGLWHACGHEGAGIGLAPGTAKLLVQQLTGAPTDVDLTPFRPDRFEESRTTTEVHG